MCEDRKQSFYRWMIKALFALVAVFCVSLFSVEARAEEKVHVVREATGDLEQLEAIEISDEEAEEWLEAEESQNQESPGAVSSDPFLEYGSDYGYRDMKMRSNPEGRQYLYKKLLEESKVFTVDGTDAGTVETSSGIQYAEAVTVDVGDYDLTEDEKIEVYFTFRHDNPQFFWLSNRVVYSTSRLIVLTYDEYRDGGTRTAAYDEIVGTAENVYQSKISETDSYYEKILKIHDTLIADIKYSEDTSVPISHSIAGAMTSSKSAVCEGYAKVMQVMMNCYGINNIFVTGLGNGGAHAWNMVQMDDGAYYWLDATWDDQPYEQFQHDYFLVGNKNFTGHVADTPDGNGTSFLYALPKAADEDYVYNPEEGDGGGDQNVKLGDINGDEEIDIFDLTLCMNHIVEKKLLEGIELEAADVNKDEEVDIFDLTRIMNYICEKIDTI